MYILAVVYGRFDGNRKKASLRHGLSQVSGIPLVKVRAAEHSGAQLSKRIKMASWTKFMRSFSRKYSTDAPKFSGTHGATGEYKWEILIILIYYLHIWIQRYLYAQCRTLANIFYNKVPFLSNVIKTWVRSVFIFK